MKHHPRKTAKGSDRISKSERLKQEAANAEKRAKKQHEKSLRLKAEALKAEKLRKKKAEIAAKKLAEKNEAKPIASKKDMEVVKKELETTLAKIQSLCKVRLSIHDLSLSSRGNVKVQLKGATYTGPDRRKNPKRTNETNAEYRFRMKAREIGLKVGFLNKETIFKNHNYIILGLKGKGNKLVLKDVKTEKVDLIDNAEFIKHFHMVSSDKSDKHAA